MGRIVVGVSGGQPSHPAIQWAMGYAHRTHSTVELVHVVDVTWGIVPEDFVELALLEAEHGLRGQLQSATAAHPDVAARSEVLVGSPTRELIKAAAGADLLVIGAHVDGESDSVGLRPGRIVAHAPCSVVVIPSTTVSEGRGLVVGVDGSDDSKAAVQFAAREADRFGEKLTVVYSWTAPEPWSPTASMLWPTVPMDEDRLVVAESVAGFAEQYPDLEIHSEVVSARPVRSLYAASVGARMLVVGSRGRHGLARVLLGSVSEEVVANPPCAVAVIRPTTDPVV